MTTKLWQLNENDWVMSPTLDQAIDECVRLIGIERDEVLDPSDHGEVSREAMEEMTFQRDDGTVCTFAEEFDRRVKAGIVTEYFASAEY